MSSALAQIENGLEIVEVTADRRQARTAEVPIPMSVLSGEALSRAGVFDADGLARLLPAFDVQRNAGPTTTSLRIRRVGNVGNIPTFEPAVAVFVDGAFRSRSFLAVSDLLAVDRVEVLRGPQTALYGKNASAGLVAIHTRRASDELELRGELTHGRFDSPDAASLGRATIEVTGPITGGMRGSFAARSTRHDHTLLNVLPGGPDGNNGRKLALRGQLSWSIGDVLDVRLLSNHLRQRGDQGESDVFLAPGAASTQVSHALRQLGLTPGCEDNLPRNRRVCSVATNTTDYKATDATLIAEYGMAKGWRVKSMTSWDQYDILRLEDDAIQLFAPILFYHDPEKGRSFQQELTVESSIDERLSWLVGTFYYRNDYKRGGDSRAMFGANGDLAYHPVWSSLLGGLPLAAPGQLGIHDSKLDTRYISLFAQASWEWTPKLSLTSRIRWQQERKDAVVNNSVTVPGVSLISAVLTPAFSLDGEPVNGRVARTTDGVPWSITPRFKYSANGMVYLTVARGYKSGGFNTGFGDAPLSAREYSDERIDHYEIGVKMGFDKPTVLLDLAAFRTRFDDYQDAAFVSTQFSVRNAERLALNGGELDATILLRDRLTLGFSVSYADLRYVTNTSGLCYPGRPPDGTSAGSCILSGEQPIHAPKWQSHLGLQYEHQLAKSSLVFRLDWSWMDEYNTSFSADPRLVQGAYSDVGIRIGAQIGQSTELVFWGDNVLNETISHFDSLLNLFNDSSYQSYLAVPRSYGVTWRFRF